jgi:hypothetical protein
MALSITQTPPVLNLAQSPIPFTLSESDTAIITSSSFQYVLDLYYWDGGLNDSGSSKYTLVKYPNESGVGIFDVSRILNSTLTDLLEANPSNVKYLAVDGYWQFFNGVTYVTCSHIKSDTYKYIDGYSIFQEPISQSIWEKTPHWPLMTDGPATQSSFDFNGGTQGVYVGDYGYGSTADKIVYTSIYGTFDYTLTGSTDTSEQVDDYPIGQTQSGFPFTGSLDTFTVQAFSGVTPLGTPITFNLTCNQKYPNIRIKWKNRYGQFDWFNFNMINTKQFNVSRSVYQPQIGSWGGSNLSYNRYDSNNLNYLVDTKENIQVNTDWVDEVYNEIFKQLLVSDEIYWVWDEENNYVRPLTIATSNLTFKTGVVNKVIQYSFEFAYGQTYKLVI